MEPVDWSADHASIEVRALETPEGVVVTGPPWFSGWPTSGAFDVRVVSAPVDAALALTCEGPRGAVRIDGVEVRAPAPPAGRCSVDLVPIPADAWRDGTVHVEIDFAPEWGASVIGGVRVGPAAAVGEVANAGLWRAAAVHRATFVGWVGWLLVGIGHAVVGARLRDRASWAYGIGLFVMALGEGANDAFAAAIGPWVPVTLVIVCNVIGTVLLTSALGRFFRLGRALVGAAITLELVGLVPGGVPVMMIGWLLTGLASLWAGVRQRRAEATWVAVAIALVLPYNLQLLLLFSGFDAAWWGADAVRWLYIAAPPVTGTAMLAHRHLATWRNAQRFVPRDFLLALGHQDLAEVRFGEQTNLTIVVWFSDVRGFTTALEGLSPVDVQAVLTATLGTQEGIIRKHGGYVDKYIGDAVMALFTDADAAVAAAIEARHEVSRRSNGRFSIGIGLHRGPVTLGTVGSADRMDCTVVGDAVNLASRVEAVTKRYHASILVTDGVADALAHPVALRPVERVIVKGRSQAVSLFEALDPRVDAASIETIPDVARARSLLDVGDADGAATILRDLQQRRPEDGVVGRLLERAEAWRVRGAPPDPTVVVLVEK